MLTSDDLVAELKSFKFRFCRSKLRPRYWTFEKEESHGERHITSSVGAIGRLVFHVLSERNSFVEKSQKLTQKKLIKLINADERNEIKETEFSRFLRGAPPGSRRWENIARRSIEIILLGNEQTVLENRFGKADVRIANQLVKDFCDYFFDNENELSYFHERLKGNTAVASIPEVINEMDYLCYCTDELNASCRIIRTSGRDRFLQINNAFDQLTRSGEATIKCLKHGVEVIYAFPKCDHKLRAKESAKCIAEFARRELSQKHIPNLKFVELDLMDTRTDESDSRDFRWPGEFLSKMFRWAGYEIVHSNGDVENQLIVNRRAALGPNPFVPDESEKNLFFGWSRAFVTE